MENKVEKLIKGKSSKLLNLMKEIKTFNSSKLDKMVFLNLPTSDSEVNCEGFTDWDSWENSDQKPPRQSNFANFSDWDSWASGPD